MTKLTTLLQTSAQSALAGFLATIGVVAALGTISIAASMSAVASPIPDAPVMMTEKNATLSPVTSLPDGTYLYGESEQPDQPNHTYFVFEVKGGAVTGALYAPNSSFDCTQGKFGPQQLALSIIDTYDKTSIPLTMAATYGGTVAGLDPVAELGLDGMKRVQGEISDRDRQILATCKAYFAKNPTAQANR